MCRTTVYMRPTNTVNNEQQDVRGISVITPLPTGEGMGEGPVCVVVVGPLCCRGWSTRLVVVGPFVFKKVMACTTKVQATYNPFRVLMERRGLPPALFDVAKIAIILCSTNDLSIFFYFVCPQSSCSSYYTNEKLLLPLMRT